MAWTKAEKVTLEVILEGIKGLWTFTACKILNVEPTCSCWDLKGGIFSSWPTILFKVYSMSRFLIFPRNYMILHSHIIDKFSYQGCLVMLSYMCRFHNESCMCWHVAIINYLFFLLATFLPFKHKFVKSTIFFTLSNGIHKVGNVNTCTWIIWSIIKMSLNTSEVSTIPTTISE